MRHFCTYFDSNFLSRGLTLHRSLCEQCPEFTLWILCLDDAVGDVLGELDLPGVRLIGLDDFLRGDVSLQAAREDRTLVEFYFTCSPSLILYILKNEPELDLITYLDSDLYFFSSPEPLFEEMGNRSIAITPHRFSDENKHREEYGLYNVGWLSFRHDDVGIACLNWWRDRCIEWCHDRKEDGRFADQKYLDQWPALFKDVAVLNHPGANLAAWNLSGVTVRRHKGVATVDGQPLVFFHFHKLRKIGPVLYSIALKEYGVNPSRAVRRFVLTTYIRALRGLETRLTMRFPDLMQSKEIRYRATRRDMGVSWWRLLARRIKDAGTVIRKVFTGEYFIYLFDHIL